MFGKKKKKSFLEKLTGSVVADDFDDEDLDEEPENLRAPNRSLSHKLRIEESPAHARIDHDALINEPEDGQLAVDVLQTPTDIVIRTMIAGVKPSDIDIDITRDVVTIRGERHEESQESGNDFFHQELYWGSFSRTIMLPEEIDVELAEAKERHGLLTIRLPKVDKNRKTKLQVKVS